MSLQADALADRRRLRRKLSFWRIAAFLAILGAIVVGFSLATGGDDIFPTDHVARVEITGVISDNRQQREMLEEIADNDRAKALLLEIDSPGGTTTGAEGLYEAIRKVADKKPVVATLGTIAASGGYIAAIGADHIVARGNTLAGSIGVIMQWPNATELLDRAGIDVHTVRSSPIKAEPTPYTETPPEAIAVLETAVADSYDWFIGLVRERRNLTPQEARLVGDARVMTGRDALKAKLVDALGGEDVARAWLDTEHGISPDLKLKSYKPADPLDPWGGSVLARLVTWLTGIDIVAAVLPAGTTLDGLVSVWHPDWPNRN